MTAAAVTVAQARSMLDDAEEVAFLDVREAVPHGFGHPLLAVNAPSSRLELDILARVPRLDTRVLLLDAGDGVADTVAGRLAGIGYTRLFPIDGGVPAWRDAGAGLFPEHEVIAKGFGSFAERWGAPEFISPQALSRALEAGERMVLIDSRPPREYTAGNIPGSIDAPGPDMVRCFDDLVPDPEVTVVVNCMTRTRGILGGLSLRAAGVPNPIRVLENGTRNWLLAGFELERGADRFAGPPSPAAVAQASERARGIADRAGISRLGRDAVDAWRSDVSRTTYVFDVRTEAEFLAGHLPGARNVAHGALYMGPDHFMATLGARVVLVDDDGVRATVNALWLGQMGWSEVAVCSLEPDEPGLESDPWQPPRPAHPPVASIAPGELIEAAGMPVVDVDISEAFVEGHVDGALWCSRPELPALLGTRLAAAPRVVVTCRDGELSRYVAADDPRLVALAGGTAAWRRSAGPMKEGASSIVGQPVDEWLLSSERPGDTRTNVEAYIDWEIGLADDITRAGDVPFHNRIWPAA